MKDDSGRWHPNPSVGLGVWGPLVPANDCRECMALCTGVQTAAGMALWWLPGRRPPPTRGLWANRGVKLAGVLAGSYLIFMAGLEATRFWLPYDPWVEDARKARSELPHGRGLLARWFGPVGYQSVPHAEWSARLKRYLAQIERPGSPVQEMERFQEIHRVLCASNRETTKSILASIKNGTFDHEPVDQALDDIDISGDEDIDVDGLDFEDLDLWSRFDFLVPMNVVIVPRSVPSNQTPVADGGRLQQQVTYAPIPEIVRKF